MAPETEQNVESAELILGCADLDATIRFFTERLGFRLALIFPADDPSVAVVRGHGLRLRLERRGGEDLSGNENIRLRLNCLMPEKIGGGERELIAPNGVRIELAGVEPVLPELRPSFVISRFSGASDWGTGRAGMRYRDLIPDRQGGRFIASHIHIPEAGPVPDYVHFHKIRFQMIYCYRGWARLVYEDQGEPFEFAAGDCVLQPPQIRHRVLESSADLEVIEIASPAEHETFAEHEMDLPTGDLRPERDFGGQRFVRHIAASADVWRDWRLAGFECLETGIGSATGGLAGVRTVRPAGDSGPVFCRHEAEFVFFFILRGRVSLWREGGKADGLGPGDALVIPSGLEYAFAECSEKLEMLEVALPAQIKTEFL
ncbi:MAG: cupin domain-containing protein [Pyrinomonadaceae bacterium]